MSGGKLSLHEVRILNMQASLITITILIKSGTFGNLIGHYYSHKEENAEVLERNRYETN